MILRTIVCVCGTMEREKTEGAGWPKWGELKGISMNGMPNPTICPRCLTVVANALDAHLNKIKEI